MWNVPMSLRSRAKSGELQRAPARIHFLMGKGKNGKILIAVGDAEPASFFYYYYFLFLFEREAGLENSWKAFQYEPS